MCNLLLYIPIWTIIDAFAMKHLKEGIKLYIPIWTIIDGERQADFIDCTTLYIPIWTIIDRVRLGISRCEGNFTFQYGRL